MIDAAAVLRTFAGSIATNVDELTSLDQASGDGDFGANLSGGMNLVIDQLDGQSSNDGNAFLIAAEVFLDNVGGTSGPLFGLLFQAIGAAFDAGGPTPESLSDGVADGLAAIQRVGDAQPGDRTMVDALIPAKAALAQGQSLGAAAQRATAAARDTARMRARLGRASYVGDRAIGHPDPGAVGTALLFGAFAAAEAPGAV